MFLGHFGVGLACKRPAPRASLGVLILASLLLDSLWPIFLATGLESVRIDPGNTVVTPLDLHDHPYTHSLATAVGWSILFAALYLVVRRDRRASMVLGLGVFSHWILDYVSHRPDIQLYPGDTHRLGLGLWNSRPWTAAVELVLFAGGLALYLSTTRARDRIGVVSLWAFVAVLLLLYASVLFGQPPPNVEAVMIGAFLCWLFVPWAWWIDRHRAAT